MSNYLVCCAECFKEIAKVSAGSARMWMDLCAVDCAYRLENLKIDEHPFLKILEMKNYILTTDRENYINIHMKGRMTTEDGSLFFCVKEGRHD